MNAKQFNNEIAEKLWGGPEFFISIRIFTNILNCQEKTLDKQKTIVYP